MPCFKLGLKFGRDDIIKRFLASGKTGFYFRVITEGEVQAGDAIVPVARATHSVTISEVTRLYARDKNDLEGLRRILDVAALPDDWRDYFKEQISRVTAQTERAPPKLRLGSDFGPSSCETKCAKRAMFPHSTSCRRTDNHCRPICLASS